MQKTQLALFPLEVFLLPGEKMRLHIFEERYRQLLIECETTESEFGIPYSENGQLSGVGCSVRLAQIVREYENGSSDIEVECTALFRINEFYTKMENKLYPGGEVSIIDEDDLEPISPELMRAFDEYTSNAKIELIPDMLPIDLSLFQIAALVGLNEKDKLKALIPSELDKLEINWTRLDLYRTVLSDLSDLENVFYDVLVFFSPSGIETPETVSEILP